jgi:hypothetical protein
MPTARDISFRQRAVPFLDMLEQSSRADEEIVWQIDGD